MFTSRIKVLQITARVVLVLLVVQYELGIAVIMSDPPAIPPVGFSVSNILYALNTVGRVSVPHAVLGGLLIFASVINLILSLGSKIRSVQIVGTIGFVNIITAAGGGLVFVLSGFQNDNASHAMATNFILAFTFYFLELYFLKS